MSVDHMPHVLAIEACAQEGNSVASTLASNGFVVKIAQSGREGIAMAMEEEYDAIALDRWLPDLDGLKVLKTLRGVGIRTPVLVTSSATDVRECAEGLRSGCDDYMTRPFSGDEIATRVEALLLSKRVINHDSYSVTVGHLTFDLVRQTLTCNGSEIKLRPTEGRVLEFLMRNAGCVLTRSAIFEGVWGNLHNPSTNLVDVHIGRLRSAIEVPGKLCPIRTVRGMGYIMRDMTPQPLGS